MGWRDVSLGYIDGNGDTKNGRHFGDRAARQNGSYAGAVQRGGIRVVFLNFLLRIGGS